VSLEGDALTPIGMMQPCRLQAAKRRKNKAHGVSRGLGKKRIEPRSGERDVFTPVEGYGRTRNGVLLVNVPPGVVTVTEPVVAPAGTVAVT
jgi:hypothetical protein